MRGKRSTLYMLKNKGRYHYSVLNHPKRDVTKVRHSKTLQPSAQRHPKRRYLSAYIRLQLLQKTRFFVACR